MANQRSNTNFLLSAAIGIIALLTLVFVFGPEDQQGVAPNAVQEAGEQRISSDSESAKAALEASNNAGMPVLGSTQAYKPSSVVGTAENPPEGLPEDLVRALQNPNPELPPEMKAQLNAPPPELPDDLRRQLENPIKELPEDLQKQLNAEPPELPEDIKRALQTPPRKVTEEEVNTPPTQ